MTSPALDNPSSVISTSTPSLYLSAADGPNKLPTRASSTQSQETAASSSLPALAIARTEQLVARWLESLLQHYSVQQLDVIAEQDLSTLLARHHGGGSAEYGLAELRDSSLIAELRRRIMRLSGAQLGEAFVSMSPDIVDEAETEHLFLDVEGRQLQGVRYQGEVYRLMDSFVPSCRLQAYCLGQTLSEKTVAYWMTRSSKRFAVWVNAKTLPQRSVSV